jgi:GntR family transcriptional regulator, transcriptional repressor for pyruvate dehydrogenase complex
MRAPAYRALADALRAQITSGRLRAGDRLPTEPQLCRSAGVSRSTVREALRLLTSEHLVVTVRGVAGGSFVAHPNLDQLTDGLCTGIRLWQASSVVGVDALFEVRAMVEVPATGLAAQRRTDGDLAALAATLFDPVTAGVDEMMGQHRAFHGAIAAASGNPLLELVTLPLHALAEGRELAENLGRDFWTGVDADHREIIAAVRAGQPVEAEAAAEAHLAQVRRSTLAAADRLAAVRAADPGPAGTADPGPAGTADPGPAGTADPGPAGTAGAGSGPAGVSGAGGA